VTTQQLPDLRGKTVFDSTGQQIGNVQRVYSDVLRQGQQGADRIILRRLGLREMFVFLAGSKVDSFSPDGRGITKVGYAGRRR
jgi:hypothetical protein